MSSRSRYFPKKDSYTSRIKNDSSYSRNKKFQHKGYHGKFKKRQRLDRSPYFPVVGNNHIWGTCVDRLTDSKQNPRVISGQSTNLQITVLANENANIGLDNTSQMDDAIHFIDGKQKTFETWSNNVFTSRSKEITDINHSNLNFGATQVLEKVSNLRNIQHDHSYNNCSTSASIKSEVYTTYPDHNTMQGRYTSSFNDQSSIFLPSMSESFPRDIGVNTERRPLNDYMPPSSFCDKECQTFDDCSTNSQMESTFSFWKDLAEIASKYEICMKNKQQKEEEAPPSRNDFNILLHEMNKMKKMITNLSDMIIVNNKNNATTTEDITQS